MNLPQQGTIHIQPVLPYSFDLTMKEIQWYPLDVTERITGNRLLRGFRLPDQQTVLTVISDEKNTGLRADMYAGSPVDTQDVSRLVRRILNLDLALTRWYSRIRPDVPMLQIIEQLHGFKPVAKPTIFESLVSAILEQQLNVEFACTLETRLIRKYGTHLKAHSGSVWLFPTPDALASLGYETLKPLQISSAKSRYIIDIARRVADGSLDLESWHELPDDQLMRNLLSLRGVGRWTAEYVAMFGYRRYNHAPAADIGLRNAVTALTDSDEQLSEEATRAYMDQWAEYRGLATYYIWHAFAVGLI
ncbi:MAG TPA: hypothetical protein VKA68_16770 [bacterium]|nr:hypothetical protein [bacterium]